MVIGVALALVVVAAALVVSVQIDRWRMRGGVEALANVALSGPEGPLLAYLAHPPAGEGPFPLVVMIHEFWGLDEATISKAELLARDGYVVVAPDLMRGVRTRWLPSAIWQTLRTPDDRVRDDLDAVVAAFTDEAGPGVERNVDATVDATRLAVLGFCFGGRMSLRYALERPAVGVIGVFYGNVTDDAAALARLGGPVLGVFGADDASIPQREVEAFERALASAGVEHEIRVFEGVGHAFVRDAEGIASDPVQAEAWALLQGFLARHLAP